MFSFQKLPEMPMHVGSMAIFRLFKDGYEVYFFETSLVR